MTAAPRAGFRAWLRVAPGAFMLAWSGNHFTPLVGLYERTGGFAPWQANLLLGVYVAGLIPGLIVASTLSDRHGRRPLMLAGAMASIGGGLLLCGGVELFGLLLVGRVLSGIGVGVTMSVGTSWIIGLSAPPFDLAAPRSAGVRRAALTQTLGFGAGAAVTGLLAQWGPAPTLTPHLVQVGLTTLALAVLATAPESLPREDRSRESLWRDLRIPTDGRPRFLRIVLPAAPWVFAAAGVAYAIMPAATTARVGELTTLYATMLSVLTLGAGALVQTTVPRIDRWTGGRSLVVGMTLMTAGMALSALAATLGDPVVSLVVALLLGVAYGICVVAGLLHVQAIATARDLAGLTGIYYGLAYTGFALPTVLAALLPVVSYAGSLLVVALLCAACLALVWSGTARLGR